MSVSGIDVSENNGRIDWTKVRHAGKRFAFVKVNEGDYRDHQAHDNVVGARGAGLLVGGYDFLRPRAGRTGAEEFDIFWARAKSIGLGRDGSLRPVADVEATGFTGATAAFRTRRYVYSWLNRCVKVTGKRPIIYTASWFWDGVMKAKNPHGCKLWVAAYNNHPAVPAGFDHISFHQYTDKGNVPGVAGNCDLNTYLSDFANLKRTHTL